ncbi:amidophosphoribosyltransferase [Marinomonas mediterranea]|jgi:amidophosphoribosyltransferase (EC 2.4.2.14)|uniref:Amidophosphoribosyltransferase n=1 Tax=Marinomonas mediterranea (strain ATCC 700492 / JCM 21426 / NBRC 103028 / MMB-1) TaxID=717774 RepID=F2K3Y5_MARM1|nr:amidophosphoribosyltransferase [Marinomonas mediterranea]ADZ91327.1 amidophosphoribosyltransferase [Marinomonas mediterranea MMB-1]WCN09298.1 amidophosphoribosyltransferase [Marinomonas mediterranea]WCN13380.1 amidophosphoribosyltransferase [Marinomonas mediterranea]WCN17448.1 amidophosphoribosyltransferase [Marinomonas mediterranea MMB-1]
MCGIVGVVSTSMVNQTIFDALTLLQHRGQDAAGMVTSHDGGLCLRKDNGPVSEVFRTRHMKKLLGNIGIGHARYPTAGTSSSAEAQPFYVNSPYGVSLAHNGNLTNTAKLKQEVFESDLRHINTTSDSEVLLNVLAHELHEEAKLVPTPDDIFNALERVYKRIEGGYAVVALITGYGILAFRDPDGVRPLIYGSRETENGMEYMVASESVALDAAGFKIERDIRPGEAMFFDVDHNVHVRQCTPEKVARPCLFEYVYFARPDTVIDNISVYKARINMGDALAAKIKREWGDLEIDVVIPIPDTSRTAALQIAQTMDIPFREGLVKNRYIGRTFIMPGQTVRKKSVRQKLNPVPFEFKDKNVLLVDDSIVRGTTSREIIEMARDAGANKVFIASAAPEVRYPNVYGIDMPAVEELIAHNRNVDEICELIGADGLIFQDLADLKSACIDEKHSDVREFDTSVFDGNYITGNITEEYLANLAALRNDAKKNKLETIVSSDMLYPM